MVTEQKPETRTASLRSIRKRPEKDQSRAKDILTPCWQYGHQIYDCTADKEPKWSWARYRKRTALVTPAEERNIGADRQRHNEMLPISSCKLKVYHEIGPNLYSYDVFLKLRKVTVFFPLKCNGDPEISIWNKIFTGLTQDIYYVISLRSIVGITRSAFAFSF